MDHHFAGLDNRNIVQRVVLVPEENCLDNNGQYCEEIAVNYCKSLNDDCNLEWIESFEDYSSRIMPAAPGVVYYPEYDAFIEPQPHPSWVLNTTTYKWDPPIPKPDVTEEQYNEGKYYIWNEAAYILNPGMGWTLISNN